MRSFRFDPYLWVHLTGIAAVPIFLELCVVGLATGEPLFPLWFELLFVGGIGILPILWMQWQRPFSIFSLLILAVKPAQLTDDQRRILHLFKTPISRVLALLTAIFMAWVLWQLYEVAPRIAPAVDWLPTARGAGLAIAAIAFLGSNLFIQVPVSVLRVLLSSANQFAAIEPYPASQVAKDFTVAGIRVAKILPSLVAATPVSTAPTATPTTPASTRPDSPQPPQSKEPTVPQSPSPTAVSDILEEEWEEEISPVVEAVAPVPQDRLDQQTVAQNQDQEDIELEDIELAESTALPDDLDEEVDTADGDETFEPIAIAEAGAAVQPVEDEQPTGNEQGTEVELVAEIVDEIVNETTDGIAVETIAIEAELIANQPLNQLEETDLIEEIVLPENLAVEEVVIEVELVAQDEAPEEIFEETSAETPADIAAQLNNPSARVETAEAITGDVEILISTDDAQSIPMQQLDQADVTIIEDETIAEFYPTDDSTEHE